MIQRATNFHQELDRLRKGGDGLTGLLQGPSVFYATLTIPIHLSDGAWKTNSVIGQQPR